MSHRDPVVAPVLSIVVPCYNEEAVLHETHARLAALREHLVQAGRISPRSEIIFVDDGSRDRTWPMIDAWARAAGPVVGVKLSRNCGHQNALLAGLKTARGDAVITIDADLQDDEGAIERMLTAFADGNEVVYGVRARRDSDTWFKRTTARLFYRGMHALGVQTVTDHADYRLLSQRAIRYLSEYREANLFLRGVVPLLGLRSAVVHYDRQPRQAGESKYPLRKMVEFALDGVTSFSTAPLRAIALLGFALSVACVLLTGWVLVAKFMAANTVPGWASTILPIYFLGGVQLLCAGVLGEYVGKIYMEVKRRPRFFVEQVTQADGAQPVIATARPARLRVRPRRQRAPADIAAMGTR
jgi:glycosyltransferase involved in cell wall biosynthesis